MLPRKVEVPNVSAVRGDEGIAPCVADGVDDRGLKMHSAQVTQGLRGADGIHAPGPIDQEVSEGRQASVAVQYRITVGQDAHDRRRESLRRQTARVSVRTEREDAGSIARSSAST
jgi:hypothetical protein